MSIKRDGISNELSFHNEMMIRKYDDENNNNEVVLGSLMSSIFA